MTGISHFLQQLSPCRAPPCTIHTPIPTSRRTFAPRDTDRRSRRGGEAPARERGGWGGRTYRVACSLPSGLEALQVYCWPGSTSLSWLTVW